MELIRGLQNLTTEHSGCVLTIGKFDGVHKGHQAVLNNLRDKARAMDLPSVVMVFEPQPEEVFTPESAPARLSTLRDKFELFKAHGIDRLVCVRFTPEFAAQSPRTFVEELLVQRLAVKFLVVGDDFRFGRQRKGDFAMLQAAGQKENFEVVSTKSFMLNTDRISSTAIRQALTESNFERVTQMLGRPFALSGKVIHGEKKGRTIGFPTANMRLNRCRSPLQGVFAVMVEVDNKVYKGVANIGQRPTVAGERMQLEVHLFDFSGSLYGKVIRVIPMAKLRAEQRFDSFTALKQQITHDAEHANAILSSLKL